MFKKLKAIKSATDINNQTPSDSSAPESQDSIEDFVSEPVNNPESDPFLHSLEIMTPDDISPIKEKAKITKKAFAFEIIRKTLLFICICAFIGSTGYIIYTIYSYRVAENFYSDLQEDFFNIDEIGNFEYDSSDKVSLSPHSSRSDLSMSLSVLLADVNSDENDNNTVTAESQTSNDESYNSRFEQMKAKINYYKQQSDDVQGFIYVPETNISYLICQSNDNDYYLRHTYSGDFVPAGSIFADYRCLNPVLRNFNYILYGHNMGNGLMFHDITLFLDETFFNENKYIYLYTLDGIYKYEIFAIHKASKYDDYIRTAFSTTEDFIAFAYSMQEKSIYNRDGGMEFISTDRIITLSTCTNGLADERYALQAKLIKIES